MQLSHLVNLGGKTLEAVTELSHSDGERSQ